MSVSDTHSGSEGHRTSWSYCPVLTTSPRIHGGHSAQVLPGVTRGTGQWRLLLSCFSPPLPPVSLVSPGGTVVSTGAGTPVSLAGNQEVRVAYSDEVIPHRRVLSSSMCIQWAWHPRRCRAEIMAGSALPSFAHACKQT